MSSRDSRVRHLYALEPEDYAQLLAAQSGGCAVCGKQPAPGAHLDIDHDHKTHRIRGLLCRRCNGWLIARYRGPEGASLFAAAAQYLAEPPASAILPAEHRIPAGRSRKRRAA